MADKPSEPTPISQATQATGAYVPESEYGYVKSDTVPKFWRGAQAC